MAVTFNINNPDSCQRAYLNYHCYGNTMNISPADMGAILAKWGDKVETWEKSAEANDSVDYEFDNSDFEKYKDQYSGNGNCVGGEIARGVGDLASPVAAMALKTVAKNGTSKAMNATIEKGAAYLMAKNATKETLKNAGKKGAGKAAREAARAAYAEVGKEVTKEGAKEATKQTAAEAAKKATEEATKEVTTKATEEATKGITEEASKKATEDSAKSLGCIIGCSMAFATGLAYTLKQPNKEEAGVVKELNEKMGTAQSNLITQQNEMATAQEEIVTMVGEAEAKNEEANSFIAEQEATQQFTLTTINSIKAKQESGARLTASERSLFNDSVKLLNESNVAQSTAGTDAQDEVASLYSEIEGKQTVYDTTADTMSDIQGMTQYAESMDTATAVSCGIEAAAQGLNVISGGKSAIEAGQLALSGSWAFGATAWAWAFVALGAAGAAMSGIGAIQQGKYLKQTIDEIGNRKNTQELNTSTQEIYNQELDAYAGSMSYVEELDYEIPELDDTTDLVLAQDKPVETPEKQELKKKTEENKA